MRGLICSIFAIFVTGCATTDTPKPVSCVPIVNYNLQFEQQLAKEIGTLPQNSALIIALADYGRERAALRRCVANSP